jgi:hypothetical protein
MGPAQPSPAWVHPRTSRSTELHLSEIPFVRSLESTELHRGGPPLVRLSSCAGFVPYLGIHPMPSRKYIATATYNFSHVRLILSARLINHYILFFSHNKTASAGLSVTEMTSVSSCHYLISRTASERSYTATAGDWCAWKWFFFVGNWHNVDC